MERIPEIIDEIAEKKGREFIGLQTATIKQLESLSYYLKHPKLQENNKLVKEMVDLYHNAKNSDFMKMEGIIRKLDQLRITLGKYEYKETKKARVTALGTPKKRLIVEDAMHEIASLKDRIATLMSSPLGASLPSSTQKSLNTFLNYLDNPKFEAKPDLVGNALEKYNEAKQSEFTKMQGFNHMLNMLEIKLGAIESEKKRFKTLDDIKEELEAEKEKIKVEWEKIAEEKKKIEVVQSDIEKLLKKIEKEQKIIEEEKNKIRVEENKLKSENLKITMLRENLESERQKLEQDKRDLARERKKVEQPPGLKPPPSANSG